MTLHSNNNILSRLGLYTKVSIVISIGICTFVMVGWIMEIEVVKSIIPNAATMKFNTALAFFFGSLSLWFLREENTRLNSRRGGYVLATLTLSIGLLSMLEYILSREFGIDQLFVPDPDTPADAYPGRMSFITAVCFTLWGLSLILTNFKISQYFSMAVTILSMLAVIGYSFNYQALYQLIGYGSIALHTAITFFIISLATLTSNTQFGIMKTIGSNKEGSRTFRLMLPFTTSIITLLGWFAHQSIHLGFLDPDNGIVILITLVILIYTPLLYRYAVRINKAEDRYKYLSFHDSLTGLFNRSYFQEELSRLEQGRQYPVSILMADVDDLKVTNDRFGHAAGDALLKQAAQTLTTAFRTHDVVARIGGDEFAVLLPATNKATAIKLVERVREVISEQQAAHPEIPLGLSLGVSTANRPTSLTTTLKKADAHMYREKQNRDQSSDTLNKQLESI